MAGNYYITNRCFIRDQKVSFNDNFEHYQENFLTFAAFIKTVYKKEQVSYPKFYKMDNLSKLGFLSAEIVLRNSRVLDHYKKEEFGVFVANSSASLDTDMEYQETIRDKSNYFPSPSVFVYTLPNILIGEICIKHAIRGENAFLVSEGFDPEVLCRYVAPLLDSDRIHACLCGWAELFRDTYESGFFVIEKESELRRRNNDPVHYGLFNKENLMHYFQNRM